MSDNFFSLWDNLSDPQKVEFWNLLKDTIRENLWELLKDPQKEGLWELLKDPQKKGLWELLKDPQKKGLWELLKDPQKKGLWELLKDPQKAVLLEMLSRPYSFSHIVFSMRRFIENQLKSEADLQKYHFTNVYISLEESVDTPNQNKPEACVITRIKEYNEGKWKTLYIKILYDTSGGTVKYDGKSRVSKQCSRFLTGHEVAHIILDLNNIVKNSVEGKLPKMPPIEETKANFFAYILSDLRDSHILKHYCGIQNLPSEEVIANSYRAEMKNQNINPDDVIDAVLKLNREAKKITMSNSIFATKKIMNVIHSEKQRRISLIYPNKTSGNKRNITQIECFKPEEENKSSFGYAIILPNQDSESPDLYKDSCCIAKAIGAILLDYDTIKKKELEKNIPCFIPIDSKTFSMERLQDFANNLSKTRRSHLNDFATKEIKSQNRIIDMK